MVLFTLNVFSFAKECRILSLVTLQTDTHGVEVLTEMCGLPTGPRSLPIRVTSDFLCQLLEVSING